MVEKATCYIVYCMPNRYRRVVFVLNARHAYKFIGSYAKVQWHGIATDYLRLGLDVDHDRHCMIRCVLQLYLHLQSTQLHNDQVLTRRQYCTQVHSCMSYTKRCHMTLGGAQLRRTAGPDNSTFPSFTQQWRPPQLHTGTSYATSLPNACALNSRCTTYTASSTMHRTRPTAGTGAGSDACSILITAADKS